MIRNGIPLSTVFCILAGFIHAAFAEELIIQISDGGSITIGGFRDGDFGIRLIELPEGEQKTEKIPYTNRTISEWALDLNDPKPEVRQRAAQALGYFGTPAISSLLRALRDDNLAVRHFATRALIRIGPTAIPELAKMLRDTDDDAAHRAGEALGKIGKASVPVLLQALREGNMDVWRRVYRGMGYLNPEGRAVAVQALIETLQDQDNEVRVRAISGLRQLLPEAQQAIPALINALDGETELQKGAVSALIQIGPKAASALVQALRKGNKNVRSKAFEALNNIGQGAVEAVPALIQAMEDADDDIRIKAARVLSSIGPAAASAVPILVHALSDTNADVQRGATEALRSIRESAVPALIQALRDAKADRTRLLVIETLGAIGPWADKAAPALIPALHDTNPVIRQRAADSLVLIGPAAVPPLMKVLRETNEEEVKFLATKTLGELGQWAVPALVEAMNDPITPNMQRQAAIAFSWMALQNKLSPSEKSAVAALEKALRSPDTVIQLHATIALFTISENWEKWTSALAKALGHDNKEIRLRAAMALGWIGPGAKEAAPALRNLIMNDPDPEIQGAAQEALYKIEGQ